MKLLLLACLALPTALLAEGGLPNQPYIYVEGKAEIEKPADMVTLRFDLVARNADQTKANQEVQAKASRIFGLLDDKKISRTDVTAADLRSAPQYEGDEYSRQRGKIIGYNITRPFAVKLRDIAAFPKLVDELLAITGVEFSEIDAGLSKEKEMQDEIWKKALANARERAETTLNEIGLKIDSIFAVSPVAFTEIHQKILGSNSSQSASYTSQQLAVQTRVEYRLPPVAIKQSVHVIYLVSPVK